MHIIAAKAVCFGEALRPEFAAYQQQVVKNCQALARALEQEGFSMLTGGTDNHLILLDLRNMKITGREMEQRLDQVYITVNKNAIPNDPQKPTITSGIRVGTAAVTTRGFGEAEMAQIAHFLKLTATDFEASKEEIRRQVEALCARFPIYK